MSLINTTRRALLGSLPAAALLAASAPACAREEQIAAQPQQATYVNGGVGREDEQHMRRIARDWPLRMLFSERKDNEFVADVSLLITDTSGKPYLRLGSAGPMTYAKLPAGEYRVTARFRGQPETQRVALDGKSGRDVYFHWAGAAKKDPYDGHPLGGKQSPG